MTNFSQHNYKRWLGLFIFSHSWIIPILLYTPLSTPFLRWRWLRERRLWVSVLVHSVVALCSWIGGPRKTSFVVKQSDFPAVSSHYFLTFRYVLFALATLPPESDGAATRYCPVVITRGYRSCITHNHSFSLFAFRDLRIKYFLCLT